MENDKIFVPGNLRSPAEFFPVPAYFENTKWRLASNGVWIGTQLVGLLFITIFGIALTGMGVGANRSLPTQVLVSLLPAIAMMVVFANGSLDLSLGAVSALVAAVTVQLIAAQVPSGLAALIGLVVALVIGLVNGFLIGAFRLPGLLVTLIMGILARGLVLEALQGQTIPVNPENTGFLPVIGWIFLILIAAAAFLWIQLPGVNARLAEKKSRVVGAVRSGAPYLLSALTAGIVGLVLVNYFQVVTYTIGQNMEFDSLVVIILAGTCLYGRFGNIVAVIPAALAVTQIKFFVAVANSPAAVSFIILAVIGLFSLGWLYLYHWIVGLLYRSSQRKKAAAPSA